MGLFDKKFCSVCGNKVGTLFHRKLEDGYLCKDCTSKLSPFFSERRSSTAEEIREQLEYREENREAVAAFHITRTLGKDMKVHLDEDNRKFMVTRARDIQEANPDVLDYSQVAGVDVDVTDSQSESRYRDKEGKMVSYIPAKYIFSESIKLVLHVNHRFFDTITVPIDTSITLNPGNPLPAALKPQPKSNREFMECFSMANEIKRTLLSVRQQGRKEEAPKKAVVCPHCTATTIPDANGCCEYCGGAIG